MNLALWLKKNSFRADQVQTFLPSPMATATTMYHTERQPAARVRRGGSEAVEAIKGLRQRRLHKAFLRYHDPENWPLLREALKRDGPRRPDRAAAAPAGAVSQPPGTGAGAGKAGDRPRPGRHGRRPAFHHEGRAAEEVTVSSRGDTRAPAVVRLSLHEVEAPEVIVVERTQPQAGTVVQPKPAARSMPAGDLQPLAPPDALILRVSKDGPGPCPPAGPQPAAAR